MNYLKLKPVPVGRIWGGRALLEEFSRPLPKSAAIGESWEISDRPEICCTVDGGKFSGMTLRDAVRENSEYIMGPRWDAGERFPVLVKWLDASEALSVQVHPDESAAKLLGGESKVENWYVYKAAGNAKAVLGLRDGVTPELFERSVGGKGFKDLLNIRTVRGGDSILVPPGCLHAIGGGTLALEIQQNSDTTYRVFDWNRLGADAKPRTLHIGESMRSINFKLRAPRTRKTDNDAEICKCGRFSIRVMNLPEGGELKLEAMRQPRIISVVRGSIESSCGGKLGLSESAILPYAQPQYFKAVQKAKILLTENFSNEPDTR